MTTVQDNVNITWAHMFPTWVFNPMHTLTDQEDTGSVQLLLGDSHQ